MRWPATPTTGPNGSAPRDSLITANTTTGCARRTRCCGPHEYDAEQRLVRYRATPHICNACPTKHRCTTSDLGREIVRPLGRWPHSEAGRFHRVVALVLVILASLITVVEVFRHYGTADVALLAGVATVIGAAAWWLTGHLRASPADFPTPTATAAQGLRLTTRGQDRGHGRWGVNTRSTP
jgi:hypothetical protein